MRELFKPWRRKIGVVTLVMACGLMACGLMALWVRSIRVLDNFYLPQQDCFYSIESVSGTLRLAHFAHEMKQNAAPLFKYGPGRATLCRSRSLTCATS